MNWNEAIEHLSAKVAAKHGVPVSDALKDAVREGLEYECVLWCSKQR